MPDIPKTQTGLIQHTRATTPLTQQVHLKHHDDGNAEGWANFGKAINAGVSALAEFQRKAEETENNLSAAEARYFFTKLNADLTQRMADNPGAFNDFKKWAEETDKVYEEGAKQYLDRMTPEFRKLFEVNMKSVRVQSMDQRIRTGMQAKVTADYNRFETLFKELAMSDPVQAKNLLDENRGKLISEQVYQTRLSIDLPRISQGSLARRMIDAATPGIIETLEKTYSDGKYVNFPNITDDKRRELVTYAKAKDSRRRYDENTLFLDQLNSGKVFSAKDVENAFAGKTSPEDLRQKQEQLKMVSVFESNRKRAIAAANKEQLDRKINNDEFKIYTFNFSPDANEAKQQYTDLAREIKVNYAGDMGTIDRLMTRLDAAYRSVLQPKTSYKQSAAFKTGQAILDGFKVQGMYAAGKEGKKEDNTPETARYLENIMESDLANFVQDNPGATAEQVKSFLNGRIELYNKTPVANIAEMQFNNFRMRAGRESVEKRNSIKDGSTGTFNGKKVVFKKGKWQYAE